MYRGSSETCSSVDVPPSPWSRHTKPGLAVTECVDLLEPGDEVGHRRVLEGRHRPPDVQLGEVPLGHVAPFDAVESLIASPRSTSRSTLAAMIMSLAVTPPTASVVQATVSRPQATSIDG